MILRNLYSFQVNTNEPHSVYDGLTKIKLSSKVDSTVSYVTRHF